MDRTQTVSRKVSWWLSKARPAVLHLVRPAACVVAISALFACQSDTPIADGLLLAFESQASAGEAGRIRVLQSIPDGNAAWTVSTPWINTHFPETDTPKNGVGAGSDAYRGRLVGWTVSDSANKFRGGAGVTWDANPTEPAQEKKWLALDSPPTIARHGRASWLIAQSVQRQSKLFIYWPEEHRSQEQNLGDAAFTSFSQSHPAVATSKDRFLIVDALQGGDADAKLQIVTGNTTRSAVANAKRFTPVYCVQPRCPAVMPLVTDDWVNDDDAVQQFVAMDVAVADDMRGGFLLAVLEAQASPDPITNKLRPMENASITLKVLRSSNESFNRGDGYSVWSAVTTQMDVRRDAARYVQVAPIPGSENETLVLTVGPSGKLGWKVSGDGSSAQALTEAELTAMFSGFQPAMQPFALIRTSRSPD